MKNMDKIIAIGSVVLLIFSLAFFSMIHEEDEEGTTEEEEVDAAEGILTQTKTFVNSGKNTFITAEALNNNLNDNYAGNDPYILSIRSPEQYAKGHIPGAHNIPFRSVFTEENMSLLPHNKQIVVYCETGHTASQTTAMLQVNGFDAACLKFGMGSWTLNTTAAPMFFKPDTDAHDYQIATGEEPGDWESSTRQCGGPVEPVETEEVEVEGAFDMDQVRAACNNYLAAGKPAAMSAADLHDLLDDSDESNDPFVLSIRSAEQYAKGHIPGAVNMASNAVFSDENMETLPLDRQIVVVCYTGHGASQTTALLNINGYDAVALKFGMTSWSSDPEVAPSGYNREAHCMNYKVVVGEEAGDMSTGVVLEVGSTVVDATKAFLGAGANTMITAQALYANLNDGYSGNDPYILSVRTAEQYAKGHIPGAHNIPWREVFTEDNIATLPQNKQIVVYCYTGHTASQVTALLNVLGFDAMCLKFGMNSWTTNVDVAPAFYDPTTVPEGLPVSTGDEPGEWTSTRQCGGDDAPADGGGEEVVAGSDFDVIRQACNNYLAAGKAPTVSAADLYANLNDGDSSNDPFLLSIRSASQYAIGHIPGAVNIGMSVLFEDENIEQLPTDRQIVVICYTGHTASQTTALLNLNGYDATALKFGMTGWTTDAVIAPSGYNRDVHAMDYPFVEGEEPGVLEAVVPEVDPAEAVLEATRGFLAAGKSTMITAEALYANLNDNYGGNDPYILSIRSASQYAIGHIPGAHNIPFRSVFTEENISLLPTNKQIVVYCYTGHTASQVTAMLNVLGYDAMCLKFGMCSWTTNADITAGACFDSDVHAMDYEVATGSEPGSWATTRQCGGDDTSTGGGEVAEVESGSDFDMVRQACDNYLASGKSATMSSSALHDLLDDGDASNNPFVLSIRSATQYAIGHIPGAINIGMSSLFTEENMALLPTDRQIVVICYTGHTASQTTALLNINGFDAIAMKFGMTSWSSNTTIAPSGFDKSVHAMNYPICEGDEAGTLDTALVGDMDELIREATLDFTTAGKTTQITADSLHALLSDGYAGNDPFILSVRSASQYAVGHIPGAVNIPWRSVFTEENISLLPMDRDIVVYCYTGHTASQVTSMLNVLGFDAMCLKFGLTSWTSNATVAPAFYDPATVPVGYPIAEGAESGGWPTAREGGCGGDTGGSGGDAAVESLSGSTFDILRQACNNYLAEGKAATMSATALHDLMTDGNETNDPYLLSIRSATQFAVGHIPGAVNIGMSALFEEENLAKLPADRQIVVICYTGHTASQTTSLLNINGFDAVALKFGMTGWTTDTVVAPYGYDRATACHNYPVVVGDDCGKWDDGIIADTMAIVREATEAFLTSGKNTFITAEALYANLNDNFANNDPFILSIRQPGAYDTGHIPGAVNIPWRSVFTEENISLLPTDRQIVVYCYTGHTASQVTAMLNVLGYDALCLKFGMCSWTNNATVAPACYDPSTVGDTYPIATGSDVGEWPTTRDGGCGDTGGSSGGGGVVVSGSSMAIIRQSCNNYMAQEKAPTISGSDLFDILDDGDSTNDPFLLSIRKDTQYAVGHIPGAVNIGMSGLFEEDNLTQLPTDRQIVVICYTGHTASQTTALLNINGYDAVALKFGMTGWTNDTVIAPSGFDKDIHSHNYPVCNGTESGDIGSGASVGTREAAEKPNGQDGAGLNANLNDNLAKNDPFILSVRAVPQYVVGHIR